MEVPLPDVPCVRVRLDYNVGAPGESGNRFFLSYSGSAPSSANCVTLAGDIESLWTTNLAPLINTDVGLKEVDVLDIATVMGASGQWTGSSEGTRSGNVLPVQCATNVEFNIAERYRGGKPRFYLPPGVEADITDITAWGSSFITAVNSGVAAFFSGIEALSIGSMGTLQHVLLSYFKGVNKMSPPWRGPGYKYPPAYRDTAMHLNVTGYSCKAKIGSQKRRRTSTTP